MQTVLKRGISIIVPTMGNKASVTRLLASLKSDDLSLEIIIVSAQQEDGIEDIARQFNAKYARSNKRRSGAKNVGADLSSYPNILFLDSDMTVDSKLLTECTNLLNLYDAIIFPEETVGETLLAKTRNFVRVGYLHTLYLEAPRCFSREVFTSIRGYDEEMDGFEDLELTGRLIGKGHKLGWASGKILHYEGDVSFVKYIKKRRFYMTFRRNFKKKNGKYYGKVFSSRIRAKATYNSIKQQGMVKSILFLPIMFILFSIDLISSTFR